jgi:hypothetical protein
VQRARARGCGRQAKEQRLAVGPIRLSGRAQNRDGFCRAPLIGGETGHFCATHVRRSELTLRTRRVGPTCDGVNLRLGSFSICDIIADEHPE